MSDVSTPPLPPGSVVDPRRPHSPTSVAQSLYDNIVVEETPHEKNDFEDIFEELANDLVVPVLCSARTIGLDGDTGRLMKRGNGGAMADSGANVCMTHSEDGLVNVHNVPPITLNLALDDGTNVDFPACRRMGYLPMLRTDGKEHLQPFLVNEAATDVIISPENILHACNDFHSWTQVGYKTTPDGILEFKNVEDAVLLSLPLRRRNGLYYCPINTYTTGSSYDDGIGDNRINRLSSAERASMDKTDRLKRMGRRPTHQARHLESELWAARLGHCGEWQLDHLPGRAEGIPTQFLYHPFRFLDFKEQAQIRRQAAGREAKRVKLRGKSFYLDLGFIRSSTSDFTRPDPKRDRVVTSFDGFNTYLLIVDEASRYVWVLLGKSKNPPIDEMCAFLSEFGLKDGGMLRCDRGGELARSEEFITRMQKDFKYKVESTGADSPSRNRGAERWNRSLVTTVRTLLFGAGLEAKYWSASILHAAYLHNRRVHHVTYQTPYEGWYGSKPDLSHLKLFGSRVCVKRSGKRRAKLDRHDFRGLFLGYTATDKNIRYIDLDTGIVKISHHAVYDEAWYLHSSRPPAAQLLYDLGILPEEDDSVRSVVHTSTEAPYPPMPDKSIPLVRTRSGRQVHLRLRLTAGPTVRKTASAGDPYKHTVLARNISGQTVDEYDITHRCVKQIYVSPHPYNNAFEEEVSILKFDAFKKPTGGLKFVTDNGRLILSHIERSSPCARIH